MHHPKEAVIDGVKFILIPAELIERAIAALRGEGPYEALNTIADELENA